MENQSLNLPPSPQKSKPNFVIWIAAGVITLAIGVGIGLALGRYSPPTSSQISSYEDCVNAKGSIVQMSYPATCVTVDGQRFTQTVSAPTFSPTATPTETADSIVSRETYISTKLPELSYSAFSIKYPKSWIKSIEYFEPGKISGYFTLYLTKGDYKISITQGATDGAICLFDNEPDYNGPAVDYRKKIYANINSPIGILRRVKSKSPNVFDICQDNRSKLGYFVLPTSVGGIGYKVPLSPSNQVLAEMDDIVKTIESR